ncbi:hypothetical protein ACLKA6_011083 [Drosophila palustris]
MHKEYCICDLSLDSDYINAEDVDNADCLEALLLVQLQLSLRSGGQVEMGGVANGGHLLGLIAFALSTWATTMIATMAEHQLTLI